MTKQSKRILGIDPTVEEELSLKLAVGDQSHEEVVRMGKRSSHRIIESLRAYLVSRGVELSDISGLVVKRGPGSFTGLRVGVAIANALSYALKIPLVGEEGSAWFDQGCLDLEKGSHHPIVEPLYSNPPHITR